MVKRCCFTLLEVLVALSVLMLGFGFLMGQQALSSGRLRDAGEALARTRELTNAMEFTLLAGPSVKWEKRFLTPDRYRVTRSWQLAEMPLNYEQGSVGMQLVRLTVSLSEAGGSGDVIDELSVETWKPAGTELATDD
ncbi:MAG: type II secretion system protein [Lentisphaeria bacterium]|nr:type II secretion system protein [Lentisphaeria bacterium]